MGAQQRGSGGLVIGFGVAMIVLGVAAYLLTGRSSVTAMIPSFFGVALVACGAAAGKVGRPAIVAAFILGLLGIGGPLGRVVPDAIKNGLALNAATIVQLLFAALSAVMVVGLLTRKSSKS
uniref:Uncharacterized protein n=1 Tax=uncultured Planctomycetales bacterium HF0500_02G17 TaxID=723608 RepID=E7C4L2_9BACT|nr:hypothetical protein [uncultured Planctomycetales bacterium HF0500_02G17]